MFETVLVPTDGTDAVQPAIERALELARTYDATLQTLNVVDRRSYATLDARTDLMVETLESEAERAVEAVRERAEASGVPAETAVARGDPYREILDYADEHDADLIVMGTHGRRGVDRYLLGSVTEKVVRSSDVPVLTVRAPGAGDE